MGVGGYQQINKSFNVCAFEDYLTTQLKRLPYLQDVEQISPRVIRILGQNPGKFTLQGTNTYIVGTGPSRLIIDTAQGIPEWADLVEATLKDLGITLSHILLTHWHGDHTGGVPDLLRLYPHLASAVYKHSPSKCQREIRDGDVFAVEGATVRGFHTPGHSHDHMCFILAEENAMFTGDNVLGHGTSAVENLGLLIATWRKMLTQGCRVGYPAHGAVVPNLELKIKGELAGKTRREAQVMEKLRLLQQSQNGGGGGGGGGKRASVTVKQLVVMMHGEAVNEEVRILALEPFMEEVLRKLAEDGNVGFEIRGGEKKWFGL
ncbi:metallo-beta-lactamase domain protein [Apiospora saccharicola]|uniref:Metallo-beta-lactamase domain protein n=1 Tax=Apiospora saccharicola TaxID=335842 RepID=A0ABR1UZL3_9PEZI